MVLLTLCIYWWQNFAQGIGGGISWVKAAWLAQTLFWWYLTPVLLLLDLRISGAARRPLKLFLATMALRGVVELYMIYVTFSWHCYYGITHDLATAIQLWVSAACVAKTGELERLMKLHFRMLTFMFGIEAYFAWSFHHQIRLRHPELYFVPEDWVQYWQILVPTTIAVGVLCAYFVFFARNWAWPRRPPVGKQSTMTARPKGAELRNGLRCGEFSLSPPPFGDGDIG
jgi:hypothetical protein